MASAIINKSKGVPIDFEQKLWAAADKMRGNMDPSEYKHVALGLIFLKYISDAFEKRFHELQSEDNADPEDPDEYMSKRVFWVPKNARWDNVSANARSASIGQIIDEAMTSIDKENKSLKGVLPKDYSRSALDKQRLGDLIDLIGTISMKSQGEHDVLGRVYEYFLSRFASAEGKNGGEFYTPQSVVRLLVEMLEPTNGRIYDPCCGSGGMFVQSDEFVGQHESGKGEFSVYGQESNYTTWRLCKMNLAIRGIDGNIGSRNADTFHNDLHRDLKADYIIANPPFNISDWGADRLRDDVRWKYGKPPLGNANFAWVQHIVHHLSPRGFAGFVLANGSMTSTTNEEGEIRKRLIEDDLIDCMVALPSKLFYSTQIPVCLWFLAKDRSNGLVKRSKLRNRRGEILFIDCRDLGHMVDRTHRDFDNEKDIRYIADAYHSWRGEDVSHDTFSNGYRDVDGFCRSVNVDELKEHGYVLSPGRYVRSATVNDDGIPFEQRMQELVDKLRNQVEESKRLDIGIKEQLGRVGYEL